MANTNSKTIVTVDTLSYYDGKIKTKMAADDAATLASAKAYADGLADNYDAKGTAEAKVKELSDGAVKANTDAIAKLNGDDTVEGSVDKKIKDSATALKAEISASAYDDTELKGRVTSNEEAIATLTGEGEGSVNKLILDEINKIIGNAPENFNSFKEFYDWVTTHETSAAEMLTQVNANKEDIAKLKTLVNQLPEDTEATTIVDYVKELIDALETKLTTAIATAKTEAVTEAGTNTDTKIAAKVGDVGEGTVKDYIDTAKSDAITDAGSKADKALEDAKKYTDALAERVTTLEENPTYTPATDEDIDALFPDLGV